MKISITIANNVQSLNKLLNAHWGFKREYNRKLMNQLLTETWNIEWDEPTKANDSFLIAQLKNESLIQGKSTVKLRPYSKVNLTIHNKRGGASKLLDKVNLMGGVKGLEDNLVKMGLIVDDRDQWCNLNVTQEKTKDKESYIEITIKYIQ